MHPRHIIFASLAALAVAFSAPALADGHEADPNKVVATVDGTDITLGHMIVLKQRLPQQYQQLPPDVLFEGILDQLVQQTLLGQQIETLTNGSKLTLENEERALRASDEIRSIVDAATTDEALQAAYDAAYGSAEPETEYNASHILVETEEAAAELITELEGGADFAELAMENSTGPSGPSGGQLGWFGKGAMVAPFEDAVLATEPGAISGPVQTQFGWHVIKLNETRIKDAPALEEVRGQLVDDASRAAIEARVEELEGDAEITRLTATDVDPALLDSVELLEP
ncbi:MAG: peptidylprolyl isomerase [Silicimonas sp.]|nr:peptidylprolyl isomerase [Silicimonas sp.]